MRKFTDAQQKKAIQLLAKAKDVLIEDLRDKLKAEVEVDPKLKKRAAVWQELEQFLGKLNYNYVAKDGM